VEASHAWAATRGLRLRRCEHAGDLAELGARGADDGGGCVETLDGFAGSERQARLRFCAAVMAEGVTGAQKSVAFAVDKALDFERGLDVAAAIKALAGAALVGLELRKLCFPEPKHVGFDFADTCDVPDLEVKTIGDRRWFLDALLGELRCHIQIQVDALLAARVSLHAV
jgi:hypothetical protein